MNNVSDKKSEVSQENNIKKKSSKPRCYHCNKKLKMIHFTCKCNNTFCILHQNPHSHNCPVDAKSAKKIELIKNNPKLSSKVVKI